MQNQEYISFGPWIYKIGKEHDLPSIFAKHFDQENNHELLIKVPVNKERREVDPDEHLYNFVIGIYPEYIYVMERVGDSVSVKKIQYDSIVAIRHFVRLLFGQFIIYTDQFQIIIEYNTTSQNTIEHLITLIRRKSKSATEFNIVSPEFSTDDFSFAYKNIWQRLSILNENLSVLSHQKEMYVDYSKDLPVHRIFQFIIKPKMLESIVLTNKKELIFIMRDNGFSFYNAKVYSYTYTFLPVKSIVKITSENSVKYTAISKIIIETVKETFEFNFSSNSSIIKTLLELNSIIINQPQVLI
jgi:hypothetical protein